MVWLGLGLGSGLLAELDNEDSVCSEVYSRKGTRCMAGRHLHIHAFD